ncbi:uncharacterized protein TNCV_3266741 [Trichonephila clavipes]|nr:uncharacterized protein TNCV_3266741 [Trichonephila clavipes]
MYDGTHLAVEILTRAQRLMFHSDTVVSHRRKGGPTSYCPLLNKRAERRNNEKCLIFSGGGCEMHRRMKTVYGEYSLCRSSVVEWCKRFREGCELLEDDARPGLSHHVITPERIAEVNALVLNNRKILVDEIHRLLNISLCTTHTEIHQHIELSKKCAQCAPHQLTAEQRNTRMALSLSHLQRYHDEEYGFLSPHGVTVLNWKASVRAKRGNARLHHLQRNQKLCTPVLADLRKRVALSESLNSSMKEELQRERLQNEELQRRLGNYAQDKIEREEKCMQNIVEFSKRAEINSMLEQGIKVVIEGGGKVCHKGLK